MAATENHDNLNEFRDKLKSFKKKLVSAMSTKNLKHKWLTSTSCGTWRILMKWNCREEEMSRHGRWFLLWLLLFLFTVIFLFLPSVNNDVNFNTIRKTMHHFHKTSVNVFWFFLLFSSRKGIYKVNGFSLNDELFMSRQTRWKFKDARQKTKRQ